MENVTQFSTRTDQRWYAGYNAVIGLGLGLVGGIGMWLWLHMTGPALLVGGVCVLTELFMMLILSRQNNIRLEFQGDELRIHHLDGNHYEMRAIPVSDFICRQNSLEKKRNVGRIQIRRTIFTFYGVQNYAETCRYIQENFPDF